MSVSGWNNHYKFVLSAGSKAKSVTNNLPILSVLAFRANFKTHNENYTLDGRMVSGLPLYLFLFYRCYRYLVYNATLFILLSEYNKLGSIFNFIDRRILCFGLPCEGTMNSYKPLNRVV